MKGIPGAGEQHSKDVELETGWASPGCEDAGPRAGRSGLKEQEAQDVTSYLT